MDLSYFKDIELKPGLEKELLDEVLEPTIKYPGPLWEELSPAEAALRFLQDDFESNIKLMATICTEYVAPSKVIRPYETDIFLISITGELRKFLIYQGNKIFNHKISRSKFGVREKYEIGTANSEYGTAIFINLFLALCGFDRRVSPDFEKRQVGDLGDFKIGTREFDVKHRYINDYKAGWFTDIGFYFKDDSIIGIYTLPRGDWNNDIDIKNENIVYDVSIMGGFNNNLLVLKDEGGYSSPKHKKGGVYTRKVIDTVNMLDLKTLLRLITSEVLKEDGKL